MSLAIKAARVRGGGRMNSVGSARVMGDPGLFSFLGKAAKSVAGAVTGFATGGFSGGITGALSPFVGQSRTDLRARPIPLALAGTGPGMPSSNGGGTVTVPRPGVIGAAQRFLPGGATGFEEAACPRGFHANKADYFLKDGTFVPKGTRCVRNRSRNPLNPRALRRAVARVDAGKTWQGKLHEIETGKYTKAGNRKD